MTVYNRDCFPGSEACRQPNDPDILQVGTHTVFPLSLNKVLILTNLAWVRNPYQAATRVGPNDRLFRHTIFNFLEIQTDRHLTEEEVREINFILKSRAFRYVAAAEEDWLYPERHLRSDHWRKLGDGYLLMPEPRHIHLGGEVYVGYSNGRSDAFGAYGHRPWEPGFKDAARDAIETKTLQKFQAEWAAMVGPVYRGVSDTLGGARLTEDSPEIHEWLVASDRDEMKKPGERARRRRLKRGC